METDIGRAINNAQYFNSNDWQTKTFQGVPIFKYEDDQETYRKIIADTRPDVIVETGTCQGGSSLFMQHCMEEAGTEAQVITIDVDGNQRRSPEHDKITLVIGSSLDPRTFEYVESLVQGKRVMVSLDSDHIRDHVLAELRIYSQIVSSGCYLVAEDTFLGEFSLTGGGAEYRFRPDQGGNPKDAVEIFLAENKDFEIDYSRDTYISMNPGGYLKRL